MDSNNIKERWEDLTVHIWLIMSSYGIIFAVLSFVEDLGGLVEIQRNQKYVKGILSIFLGLIFYLSVGIPHLKGAKRR